MPRPYAHEDCWKIGIRSRKVDAWSTTMSKVLGRKSIVRQLTTEALAGHCVVLCGPLGSGKTTVLVEIKDAVRRAKRPCGYASRTETVQDVTQALVEAYPQANVTALNQRQLRSLLLRAVEAKPGVALLDHLQSAGTMLKGLLRSLRGTGFGVVIAADVEKVQNHARLRSLHLTYRERWLRPLPRRYMDRVVDAQLRQCNLSRLLAKADRETILKLSEGRPGIAKMLVERLQESKYWHEGRLLSRILQNELMITTGLAFTEVNVTQLRLSDK